MLTVDAALVAWAGDSSEVLLVGVCASDTGAVPCTTNMARDPPTGRKVSRDACCGLGSTRMLGRNGAEPSASSSRSVLRSAAAEADDDRPPVAPSELDPAADDDGVPEPAAAAAAAAAASAALPACARAGVWP